MAVEWSTNGGVQARERAHCEAHGNRGAVWTAAKRVANVSSFWPRIGVAPRVTAGTALHRTEVFNGPLAFR